MIGWAVYLIVEVFNDGILMKNFLAAVAVALVSQAMARHFKAPVILFVIPGILPMVPGAGMYRIVYSIVMGPENMVGTYLLETATRGRRNCPWNFPRRSAAEGIFLRIP